MNLGLNGKIRNYPNPFNPVTTIEYDLPIAGYVQVTIHNIMGQELVRLTSADFHQTRRVMVLR